MKILVEDNAHCASTHGVHSENSPFRICEVEYGKFHKHSRYIR